MENFEKNKKFTVTVGIPAHNEEANIANMLNSVISQEQKSFVLERIIVILDGCVDNTEDVVREFMKKYPIMELIVDGKRIGKKERLNYLYDLNQSDFIFTFDADIILANNLVVEEMIKIFLNDDKTCLVVAHQIPIANKSFIGKIIYYHHVLWDKIRIPINEGDHIHNLHGAASALKKSFAYSFKYPKEVTSDAGFLYLMAYKKFGFKYAKNAQVFYKTPATLNDIRIQSARSIFIRKKQLADYFGEWIYGLYEIPFKYKVRGITAVFIFHPIYTLLTLTMGVFIRIFPKKDSLIQKGMWSPVVSTKNSSKNTEPFLFKAKRLIISKLYKFYSLLGLDRNIISILCYHSISDEKYPHAVNLETFSSQIEKISRFAKFVSLDEVVGVLEGKKKAGPCVAITFDDGYQDLMKALPILKKYSVPAAVFVMSEPEKVNADGIGNKLNLLTMDEIKYLHSQNIAIGAHSATHADFEKLDEKKLEREIVESKKVLEERLGFAVDYYAYPRGFYNEKIIETVKMAGFKAAFTIEAGGVNKKTDRLLIPRTTIMKNHILYEIPAVFSPVSFFFRRISKPFGMWEKFLTYES